MKNMEWVAEISKQQKLIFGPNRSSTYNFTRIYKQVSPGEERLYAYIYSGDKDRSHDEGFYKLIQVRKLKEVIVTKKEEVTISKLVGYSSEDWTMKNYRDRLTSL